MKIDIGHIAELAHLRIDSNERSVFEKDMEAIVSMVEGLPRYEDTPVSEPLNGSFLREDSVSECTISREELLRNAPQVRSGCLAVPKTVE